MRLKVFFSRNIKPIEIPLNKEVNGFINNVLGEDNKYHGSFSRYSVSSMQKGIMDKNGIINFPNGGFIFVSSDDDEFIVNFLSGISLKQDMLYVSDMKYERFEIDDFIVNDKFDLVRTVSPILISDKGKSLTFNDDSFIGVLTEKAVKKLIRCGYDENLANSISIKLFHPENAKTKMVQIGEVKNIANQVMLYVEGNKNIRRALYELGFGKCTGFGFGAVNINSKNIF